ncbi:MAG: flippase-like domain-containing protein [bacterium]|nr:flippase-like domain-containing protein [bacterium]
MKKNIVRLAALVGILIFAFIIYKIGPKEIWQNITKISLTNFLILIGLRILYWLLRTINWKIILDAYEGKTSLLNLFIARMSGHAISQLTPTAQVGSEATRIVMAKCSSRKVCIASVIVDKTTEFLAVVFFTIIGVIAIFFRIPLPGKLKTVFIVGVVAATLLMFFLISKQKKGLLSWVLNIIGKLRIRFKFLEKNKDKIRETDEHISEFYRSHRPAFLKSFLLYSLLIMLWVTEIHLGLLFIGVTDISFVDSFLITVLGNLAFVFPFIPGSLGVYEATYIGLFALLGKSSGAALTLVLIRRTMALLLAGLGLLGMLMSPSRKKS